MVSGRHSLFVDGCPEVVQFGRPQRIIRRGCGDPGGRSALIPSVVKIESSVENDHAWLTDTPFLLGASVSHYRLDLVSAPAASVPFLPWTFGRFASGHIEVILKASGVLGRSVAEIVIIPDFYDSGVAAGKLVPCPLGRFQDHLLLGPGLASVVAVLVRYLVPITSGHSGCAFQVEDNLRRSGSGRSILEGLQVHPFSVGGFFVIPDSRVAGAFAENQQIATGVEFRTVLLGDLVPCVVLHGLDFPCRHRGFGHSL